MERRFSTAIFNGDFEALMIARYYLVRFAMSTPFGCFSCVASALGLRRIITKANGRSLSFGESRTPRYGVGAAPLCSFPVLQFMKRDSHSCSLSNTVICVPPVGNISHAHLNIRNIRKKILEM